MKKKLTNIWDGGAIRLELDTHDLGRKMRHVMLEKGKSLEVEEEELTPQVEGLAKKGNRKPRRPPALLIEDVLEEPRKAVSEEVACDICDVSFDSLEELIEHMDDDHDEENEDDAENEESE